ncbi:TIM barrel protein [Rubrivirga sp. S365]|uniref:TIM barrel protein n=1 Tax=Rubrivirga litoralis TaxID=3075598 RepID=A0ABU3BMN2_9BACT|nr:MULTISPECIES: TIM barrel protein [unclassified Rubrivirga]MDT0630552.1 TIM barrel protein [Rubrivirga sp. F394]MDT7857736.1 TIM barrel protein [Rubrivirga sp. S365]
MTPAWTPDVVTPNLERAVHYTLLWGLEGVSLRTVGGVGDRVPFVNEAAARRRLDEADLPVVAVDPGVLEGPWSARAGWLNDLALLDEAAAFAVRLGCGVVRTGALGGEGGPYDADVAAGALRRAGDVAGARGVRLAVRNGAGTGLETGAALAALLSATGHEAVGADWRPSDALAAGEAPGAGLDALLGAGVDVVCVGVRDGAVPPGGAGWAEAAPGEGAAEWADQLAALAAAGFDGPLVLDALPAPPAQHGLAAATALVRLARTATRAAAGAGRS